MNPPASTPAKETSLKAQAVTTQQKQQLSAKQLAILSARLRIDVLDMIFEAQSGHPGSSFSCLDLLSYIWFNRLSHDVKNPEWPERDRFVMSKGHGAPAYYAVLMEAGYIYRATRLPNTLKAAMSLPVHWVRVCLWAPAWRWDTGWIISPPVCLY